MKNRKYKLVRYKVPRHGFSRANLIHYIFFIILLAQIFYLKKQKTQGFLEVYNVQCLNKKEVLKTINCSATGEMLCCQEKK